VELTMQNPREVRAAQEAQARAKAAEVEAQEALAAAEQARAISQTITRATQTQLAQGDRIQAMREAIRRELAELEERRDEISEQLQNPMVGGANRQGLERRIVQLDARISALETQGAELDATVARAAGGASTLMPPRAAPGRRADGGDDPFIVIGALFMLCVALPLSIAYARRLWRRGSDAVASIPSDLSARLSRIEQNVDTVALEVERIGESQRFITRAFTEQRGLKPAADPVPADPGFGRPGT
jgi:hypothetical protein